MATDAATEQELRRYQMLIGGEWRDATSGETFDSVNPFTGKPWAVVPRAGAEDVDAAVRAARRAFDEGPWGRATGTERARLLRRLAELIAEHADRIAVVETTDNGKLLREMGGQLNALPEWYLLLRRRRGQDPGRDDPGRQAELLRLHPARAGRRGRGDHAVELAAAAAHVEARAGARRRAARSSSSPPSRRPPRRSSSRGSSRRPGSRPASSTSSPASVRTRARRSPPTPASTRSRSPARPPPGRG